jgi:hypothetical protein
MHKFFRLMLIVFLLHPSVDLIQGGLVYRLILYAGRLSDEKLQKVANIPIKDIKSCCSYFCFGFAESLSHLCRSFHFVYFISFISILLMPPILLTILRGH